jgi:hypothetical protein
MMSFVHSSIPHTKLLLVPNNLFGKLDGFEVSLPKAITSGVAQCFGSSKNYGPPDNHVILSKPPAFNGFDLSLPEAVRFWTSQLLMDTVDILVS